MSVDDPDRRTDPRTDIVSICGDLTLVRYSVQIEIRGSDTRFWAAGLPRIAA